VKESLLHGDQNEAHSDLAFVDVKHQETRGKFLSDRDSDNHLPISCLRRLQPVVHIDVALRESRKEVVYDLIDQMISGVT
jgi:hypothetical protein